MRSVNIVVSWLLGGVTGMGVTFVPRDLPVELDSVLEHANLGNMTREEEEGEAPPGHKEGGLPLISDSVFSLIIMLYVLLAFFFVFFLFCWKRGPAERSFRSPKVSLCSQHYSMVTLMQKSSVNLGF